VERACGVAVPGATASGQACTPHSPYSHMASTPLDDFSYYHY
jgi:hypothetical protein